MKIRESQGECAISVLLLSWTNGLHVPSYLERGFPLKSAISRDLQNLMLSGISGMSGKKQVKEQKRLEKMGQQAVVTG